MHLSSFGMRPFVLDATLRLPAVCEELAECATCHMCRGVSSFHRSSIGTNGRSTSCTFCEALHMSPAKPFSTGVTRKRTTSKLMLPSDMASKHWLPAATSDADDVALLADLQKRLEMGKRGPEKQNSQHYAQALALARGAEAAATIADVPKGGARDRVRQTRNAMVTIFLIEGSNIFGPSAPPPLDEAGVAALATSVAAHSTAKVAAIHMSPAKPSTSHKSSKLMLPSDMASKHWLPAATSDADDVALLAGRERRCGWFAALVVVVDPQRPLASVCACMGCSGIAPVPLLMVSVQEACLHA